MNKKLNYTNWEEIRNEVNASIEAFNKKKSGESPVTYISPEKTNMVKYTLIALKGSSDLARFYFQTQLFYETPHMEYDIITFFLVYY